MKITLMEAVMANLAAEEVGRQAVPYSLALALMKVKQATAAEAETFAAEERKLVEKFAAKDEDGNIRVAQGRFTFRAPGERGEYEEQHRQLAETPAEIRFTKLRAPAPDTISVKSLEVLSRFIDFRGGDRKRLLSPAGDQVAADAVQDAAGPRRSVLLGQAVLGGRDHVLL